MTEDNGKEMIRMELQIGQLIRVVANVNERLTELESQYQQQHRLQQIFLQERVQHLQKDPGTRRNIPESKALVAKR